MRFLLWFLAAAAICMLLVVLCCGAAAVYLLRLHRFPFSKTLEIERSKGYLGTYETDERVPFTVKSFDGYVLHAEYLPAEQPTGKLVILSHGYAYDRHGSIKYVPLFRRLGYACVIYDNRGCGENKRAVCTFGKKEKRDLACLIDACRSQFGPVDFLALHGESMGAALSLLCLEEPVSVDCVISDCAFANLETLLRDKLKAVRLPLVLQKVFALWSRLLFRFNPQTVRPAEAVRNTATPLCFVHGTDDRLVPFSNAETLYRSAGEKSELHPVEHAGHAESFAADPAQYFEMVKQFLEKVQT